MRINYKKISLLVLFSALLLMAFARYNKRFFERKNALVERQDSLNKLPKMDTVLLKKFNQIISSIDLNAKNISLSGILNIYNGSDTASNIRNAEYHYYRQGEQFYFRLGKTESLNTKNQFIYVDEEQKKILISSEKKINMASLLPELPKLADQLNEEHYQIAENQVKEGYKKLSIFNPNHISCKEYSIVFSEDNLKLMKVVMRLRDLNDPLNAKKDKIINMQYTQGKSLNNAELLKSERIVKKITQKYMAVGNYKDFEIVAMN